MLKNKETTEVISKYIIYKTEGNIWAASCRQNEYENYLGQTRKRFQKNLQQNLIDFSIEKIKDLVEKNRAKNPEVVTLVTFTKVDEHKSSRSNPKYEHKPKKKSIVKRTITFSKEDLKRYKKENNFKDNAEAFEKILSKLNKDSVKVTLLTDQSDTINLDSYLNETATGARRSVSQLTKSHTAKIETASK